MDIQLRHRIRLRRCHTETCRAGITRVAVVPKDEFTPSRRANSEPLGLGDPDKIGDPQSRQILRQKVWVENGTRNRTQIVARRKLKRVLWSMTGIDDALMFRTVLDILPVGTILTIGP